MLWRALMAGEENSRIYRFAAPARRMWEPIKFTGVFCYGPPENRQETHMRSILLSGAVIATLFATTLVANNASAENRYNGAYCVQIHGNPGALRCIYETFGACQVATNSGEGTCVENRKFRWDLR
jgi:hypothetical protein